VKVLVLLCVCVMIFTCLVVGSLSGVSLDLFCFGFCYGGEAFEALLEVPMMWRDGVVDGGS